MIISLCLVAIKRKGDNLFNEGFSSKSTLV